LLVISRQFSEHLPGGDELRIVVFEALMSGDIANGTQGGSTNLARAFGDSVCHRKELLTLLIEEQMIIAKIPATHVPMEILRLHVKGEDIGQQLPKGIRNLYHPIMI
jgi:hypothetical protein